jgi:uncharacterized repeat protein (TIGR01451 family)
VGDKLLYRIEVSNLGPAPATRVTLTDLLPAPVAFQAATSSQGKCSRDGRVVVCQLGTIAPGQLAQVSIVVRPTEPGVLKNSASANSAEEDPVAATNSDVESTRVLAR